MVLICKLTECYYNKDGRCENPLTIVNRDGRCNWIYPFPDWAQSPRLNQNWKGGIEQK